MFFDEDTDYQGDYYEGCEEGFKAGLNYAIDLLQSEEAEMWRRAASRIPCAQPTAQKLGVLVEVLKKERDK